MIGHDLADALPELRAQAESLMVTTCRIDRQVTTWDEGAQKSVTTWTSIHAGIPCAVDDPPVKALSLVTDEVVARRSPVVKVPATTVDIQPDDRVTVAGFGVMWVTHAPTRTNPVQRRIECRRLR